MGCQARRDRRPCGMPSTQVHSTAGARVGAAVALLLDLALPLSCAVCHGPAGPVCPGCLALLRGARIRGGAARVRPQPCPPGMPATWAGARLQDCVRRLVTAHKDEGRRDLAVVLAEMLAGAVAAALATHPARLEGRPVLLVPVPGSRASRRRRGDAPVPALTGRVVTLLDQPTLIRADALVVSRRVRDQSRLNRSERAANLQGAFAVAAGWAQILSWCPVILVDDVLTTGATLAEAARAVDTVRTAAVPPPLAAVVAATSRRSHAVRPDPPRRAGP